MGTGSCHSCSAGLAGLRADGGAALSLADHLLLGFLDIQLLGVGGGWGWRGGGGGAIEYPSQTPTPHPQRGSILQ